MGTMSASYSMLQAITAISVAVIATYDAERRRREEIAHTTTQRLTDLQVGQVQTRAMLQREEELLAGSPLPLG